MLSILGVAVLIAGIAELVEISAAVGALLVGIALSGPSVQRAQQLLKPLRDVFAAMFFVFTGLQVDPASLPPMMPAAIALAVVRAATKVATGWLGSGWRNLRREERWRAAVTLIPRGEFSLASGDRCRGRSRTAARDADGRLRPDPRHGRADRREARRCAGARARNVIRSGADEGNRTPV